MQVTELGQLNDVKNTMGTCWHI